MFIHLAGVGFRLTSDTVGIVLILQIIYTIFTIPQHIYSIPEFGIDDADIYINLLIQLVVVYFCYIYVKRFIGIKVLGEPTNSSNASLGQTWVYFLSPWGMQFELCTYPNGKAYEKDAKVKLWHPVHPAE